MKKDISLLVNDLIKEYNVHVEDAFIDKQEGSEVLNIVIDSSEVIDLNKITEVSRIINKAIDEKMNLDVDYVDIYSKEKGDNENE